MSKKTQWFCDGCRAESVTEHSNLPPDWKHITVTLEGFSGHPVGDYANGTMTYELCPQCQRRLNHEAHPNRWCRDTVEESAA